MKPISYWEGRLKYHQERVQYLQKFQHRHQGDPPPSIPKGLRLGEILHWRKNRRRSKIIRRSLARHEAKIAYCKERIEALSQLTHWDHLRKSLGVCG